MIVATAPAGRRTGLRTGGVFVTSCSLREGIGGCVALISSFREGIGGGGIFSASKSRVSLFFRMGWPGLIPYPVVECNSAAFSPITQHARYVQVMMQFQISFLVDGPPIPVHSLLTALTARNNRPKLVGSELARSGPGSILSCGFFSGDLDLVS